MATQLDVLSGKLVNLVPPASGGGGGGTSIWTPYPYVFSDFTAAALTQTVVPVTLPAKTILRGIVLKTSTAFTFPGPSGQAVGHYNVSGHPADGTGFQINVATVPFNFASVDTVTDPTTQFFRGIDLSSFVINMAAFLTLVGGDDYSATSDSVSIVTVTAGTNFPGAAGNEPDGILIFDTNAGGVAVDGCTQPGGAPALTVDVGNSVIAPDRYISAYDLIAAASASNYTNFDPFASNQLDNMDAPMDVLVTLTGNLNLNTMTAGAFDLWLRTEQLG